VTDPLLLISIVDRLCWCLPRRLESKLRRRPDMPPCQRNDADDIRDAVFRANVNFHFVHYEP